MLNAAPCRRGRVSQDGAQDQPTCRQNWNRCRLRREMGQRAMTAAAANRRYRSSESKYKDVLTRCMLRMIWSRELAADKALSTPKLNGYISPAKSGIGGQGSFGKRPGVKCTACGSNMSRPVTATVEGRTWPAGRDQISCDTRNRRCNCSAVVCPGGRGSDPRP